MRAVSPGQWVASKGMFVLAFALAFAFPAVPHQTAFIAVLASVRATFLKQAAEVVWTLTAAHPDANLLANILVRFDAALLEDLTLAHRDRFFRV